MTYNLKLSDERGKQLQMIAERKGTSIADLITEYIRTQIHQGVISADLPDVEIATAPSGVAIHLPGFEGEVPTAEIPVFTQILRNSGDKLTPADVERKQKLLAGLAALSGIKVEKMASGVRLISPLTGEKYAINFGIASDLADQIDRAAK